MSAKNCQTTERDELRQLRHMIYQLLLAIRGYCKHCQGARIDLVNKCDQQDKCPLWKYRRGPGHVRGWAGGVRK